MSKHDTFLRQWAMLRLVPRYPRKTDTRAIREQLADEGFKTSTRTIERDLMSLSALFPLNCDDREKPYGWSWAKDARVMDIPGMTPHEAMAFRLAETFLAELMPKTTLKHLEPHFKRAREVLKTTSLSGMQGWPGKVRVIPRGLQLIPATTKPEVEDEVYEALLRACRLSAVYHPRNAEHPTEYEVNPLGLVFRHGVTYLVCTLWNYDDIKHFAMHRIKSVRLLDRKSRKPKGFELDGYIESGAFGYPVADGRIRLKALLDQDAATHLHETPLSDDQRLTRSQDGRVLAEATVKDSAELRWWLLALGANVEVLSPLDLREEMARTINKMNKYYEK